MTIEAIKNINTVSPSQRSILENLIRQKAANQITRSKLSRGQQALWFLHQSVPESPAYTIVFAMSIRSALDVDALERALQTIVNRHPQLRATFQMENGTLVQEIRGHNQLELPVTQLPGASDEALLNRVANAARRPFDLSKGPLFRPELFTVSPDHHVLLLSVHHIVYDGWSLWLNLDELQELYAAEVKGRPANLPALATSYIEHIDREEALIASTKGDELWAHWANVLKDVSGTLDLPVDHGRPPVRELNGALHPIVLDADLTGKIKALAREVGVTPFATFLAAYQVLLSRYTGQTSIPVGTRSAGRREAELNNVVGYFVNPIVIVGKVDEDPSFRTFVTGVQEQVLDALAHDQLPFPTVVERLRLKRDPSTTPVFQASFVMQKAQRSGSAMEILNAQGDGGTVEWGGLQVQYLDLPQQVGQFDIDLELYEVGGEVRGSLKYDASLFAAETIGRFSDSMITLLSGAVSNPDTSVSRLPVVSPKALEWIEQITQPTSEPVVASACVHQTFEQQAKNRPDAIALIFEDQTLTYDELNRRANRLANRLISMKVGPEQLVGLCMNRSLDMVIGILAIIKTGAGYLPLDPTLPADRRSFILEDSATTIIVAESGLAANLASDGKIIVEIDDEAKNQEFSDGNPEVTVDLDSLIYVMYTSGTTGRPKGVQITHRNVARLFLNTQQWYRFDENDVWTLFHSFAFDVSVWELWGALLHGGRIVVVPYLVSRSPGDFVDLVRAHNVTILNQSPSAFKLFVPEEGRRPLPEIETLRLIIFAGEALDLQSLRPWFERHGDVKPQLINKYGITETTVHAMYRPVGIPDLERTKSTIGVAIPDLQIHLLDQHQQPVPIGVTGEIHVGGPGLSRGYLGRPDLTGAKFLEWNPGDIVYKSGDLARYLLDGDIEYLGRSDKQVKIRGFRIELGEIETLLCLHPDIRTAVAVPRDHPTLGKRLVAYVVPNKAEFEVANLRAYLAAQLPDYMVPSAFVVIEEIPLTGNGKLDHAALPEPEGQRSDKTEFVGPRDTTEAQLLLIWEKALGVSPIGVRDDFFQLGGHSLLAVHVMGEISQAFNQDFQTAVLFRNPTVEELAELVRSGTGEQDWSPLVPINASGEKEPFFCVAGGGGSVLYYQRLASLMGTDRPFYGLQLKGIDGKQPPHSSVESAAEECLAAIREIQPHGPYRIGGHCFGGLVAFEMARSLQEAGETVERLAILDAPAPLAAADAQLNTVEDRVIDEADWLSKIAEILAESAGLELRLDPNEIRQQPDAFKYVGAKLALVNLMPSVEPERHLKGFFNVFVANSQIKYAPDAKIDAKISLFKAGEFHSDYDYSRADDPDLPKDQSTLGWRRLSANTVEVHQVEGNHLTMMSGAGVPAMAAGLNKALG